MYLAKWAAQQIGYSADQPAVYINEIMALDLVEGNDELLLRRIRQDFETSGHPARRGAAEIAVRMNEFMKQATIEIKSSIGIFSTAPSHYCACCRVLLAYYFSCAPRLLGKSLELVSKTVTENPQGWAASQERFCFVPYGSC